MSSLASRSHGSSSKASKKSSNQGSSSKASKKSINKASKNDEQTYVELYCAIYTPQFGNYYHWAFATHNQQTRQWDIFEVVQDEQDGPFRPERHQTDPRNSRRCQNPLTPLGGMHTAWWDAFIQGIGTIPVPGEGASWNCQDYVMEIWEMMQSQGMIDYDTWIGGTQNVMPYYGPDFGGTDDGGEDEGEEEVNDEPEQEGRGLLSEEFVLDSSE